MPIIPHIRERCHMLGLTLDELAERAALDPDQLARLERNEEPFCLDECITLALALECHPIDLFEIVPHIRGAQHEHA